MLRTTLRWLLRAIAIAAFVALGACTLRACSVRKVPALHSITLPSGGGARWINGVVAERDGALLAAHALDLPRDGGDLLPDVLREAYARMDEAVGDDIPTPAVATYLGLQSTARFDAVVAAPSGVGVPDTAVIFLHGYAGNFNVYCWHMARAVEGHHMFVICPSLGPRGDWWSPQGLATVRVTLDYLRARGMKRVYLAGLSNGAVGAGVIARTLHKQLAGLILISGVPRGAPPPLPTLVVQGERDGMMPAARARQYARGSKHARYVATNGGHFVFLSQWKLMRRVIGGWLERTSD